MSQWTVMRVQLIIKTFIKSNPYLRYLKKHLKNHIDNHLISIIQVLINFRKEFYIILKSQVQVVLNVLRIKMMKESAID
jgi:hypothetical protein